MNPEIFKKWLKNYLKESLDVEVFKGEDEGLLVRLTFDDEVISSFYAISEKD